MDIEALVQDYMATRIGAGLLLAEPDVQKAALEAARYYAGYGPIESITRSDVLPGAADPGGPAPAYPDPEPQVQAALPIKNLTYITLDTDLTAGEWAVITPLFLLLVELANALLLEASRGSGVEPYGRPVAEITNDINAAREKMQSDSFMHVVITV